MEIFLAILVLSAVIFFGALISMGNERQRQAIDAVRKQMEAWAIHDLRLKREKLAREVVVDDPIAWLNRLVTQVCGESLDLTVSEIYDDPQTLLCLSKGGESVVLSPASPEDIRRMKRGRNPRLARMARTHPLLNLPHRVEQMEVSILNGGVLFDLEMPVVWRMTTGREVTTSEKIWIYK